jgi:8-oxo-dGTP pyrophosphatase MutT (NUDIX family)
LPKPSNSACFGNLDRFAAMGFVGSYLWRLRQKVGSDLVLMPGAMVVLRDGEGRVLMTRRVDDGTWCLPAGAAEEGAGFAETAAAELREETGAVVAVEGLRAFACLSRPELHTIEYANGDVTHCFAICFLAEGWSGELRADGEETRELGFFALHSLPAPLHPPSASALGLFGEYLRSGEFQAS